MILRTRKEIIKYYMNGCPWNEDMDWLPRIDRWGDSRYIWLAEKHAQGLVLGTFFFVHGIRDIVPK